MYLNFGLIVTDHTFSPKQVELLLPTCKMEELHLFVEHSHGEILQEMEAHADDNLTDVQVCEFPIGK